MTTTTLERRATKPLGKTFWEAVRDILLGKNAFYPDHYVKSRHYMRGPGPKWHEQHGYEYPSQTAIDRFWQQRQH